MRLAFERQATPPIFQVILEQLENQTPSAPYVLLKPKKNYHKGLRIFFH